MSRANPAALIIALFAFQTEIRGAMTTIGASMDNSIFASNSSNSAGGSAGILSGTNGMGSRRRGLVAFDIVRNVPAGSLITNVALTLYLGNAPSSESQDIGLHKLGKAWGEGTAGSANPAIAGSGMGFAADFGGATWNDSMFGSVSWTGEGAAGDFNVVASATSLVGGPIDAPFTWTSEAMANDVQSWLDAPGTNFGWILINANEMTIRSLKAFYSREATQNSSGIADSLDPAWRPSLTITYAESHQPTGDYNGNGIVDAADYVVWRDTLNQSVSPVGSGADGNQSGVIDHGDHDYWRARFGSFESETSIGRGSGVVVPEPVSVTSILVTLGLLAVIKRRPDCSQLRPN